MFNVIPGTEKYKGTGYNIVLMSTLVDNMTPNMVGYDYLRPDKGQVYPKGLCHKSTITLQLINAL